MLRVLFVDDESRVLDGLRRQFRDMRHEWQMDFVESARSAIAMARSRPWDVIVTDMRMPEMSGADFLVEMRKLCPASVRIVLSGQADHEATLKAAAVTHQYLAKPCDADLLRRSITEAIARETLLRSSRLLGMIKHIDSLPKLPKVYAELVVEAKRTSCSGSSIAAIINSDPGLCAELLKLANSAFFSLTTPVVNVEQAITVIGLENVISLVVTAVLKQGLTVPAESAAFFEAVWSHSVQVATRATALATERALGRQETDAAVSAGLLHDVGKLVLASNLWSEYERIVASSSDQSQPVSLRESQAFGAAHADVGAYLLALWNLPNEIVTIVQNHSQPSAATAANLEVLAVVHVADVLARPRTPTNDLAGIADADLLRAVGWEPDWQALAQEVAMQPVELAGD